MSKQLEELLFIIRQHPAFKELREAVHLPEPREYRPTDLVLEQAAQHIYRSGQKRQHQCWLDFLIGPTTSQQEKS